jgi:hypothetical protein
MHALAGLRLPNPQGNDGQVKDVRIEGEKYSLQGSLQ